MCCFLCCIDPEQTIFIQPYEQTHAKGCLGYLEKRAHTIDDYMKGKYMMMVMIIITYY
jgi:hypothetical protein